MKRRIILAGGTGFLGVALADRLMEQDWDVVILSRNPNAYQGKARCLQWDGKTLDDRWVSELDGADAIVNLTGKNVNCRPSELNRQVILESRVDSVEVLGEAVRTIAYPPLIWIQTSSLAIYGDRNGAFLNESARVAEGYPADVCVEWEAALGRAMLPQMRWVNLRIGFVLGTEGGALPFLAKLTRLGLGGRIGSGRQYISWIHLEDMLQIFTRAIGDPEMAGVYHACTDQPETNAAFMKEMRTVLGRPWGPPAPAQAVKIGAPMLDSDPQIALSGRRCVPEKLHKEGFSFEFPELRKALKHLYP